VRRTSLSVVALIVLSSLGGQVRGAIIIDADVENDGDWSTFSQLSWFTSGGFLTPEAQEGLVRADMNNSPFPGDSITRTFTGIPLQAGTYAVEFAIGNQSNAPFPSTINIDFTGLGLGDASLATTPTPASGNWELWTIAWDVTASNPNLGNDLSWELSLGSTPTSNLGFDGVGSLSPNGNGFLVSYTAIPEPTSVTVLSLIGCVAMSVRRQRRKRSA